MLVRRIGDAAEIESGSLRASILMDAGELGSRHMTATRIAVPEGGSTDLRTHEDAETVYVALSGAPALSAAGDTQELAPGDLALISPATDHTISNDGPGEATLVSVTSPAVSADELYGRRLAADVAGYEDDEV